MPEQDLAHIDELDILTLRAIDRGCVRERERDDDNEHGEQVLIGFPEGFDLGM